MSSVRRFSQLNARAANSLIYSTNSKISNHYRTVVTGVNLKKKSLSRSFSSIFSHIETAPPDPILQTATLFKEDSNPNKVNLGIGAYRTDRGAPWVLPVVEKVEKECLDEIHTINKEYLGIDGLPSLKEATQKLILGNNIDLSRIASAQTLSGTGSCRVAGDFLNIHLNKTKIYISDPTWGNHPSIFKKSGMEPEYYPYWDPENKKVRFDEWLEHVEGVSEEGSVYLIHPCAHNPTGMDPTIEQWEKMVKAMVKKNHICILDSAYQGYASGSLEKDREAIEMFVESGMELLICQSFAKNLGLYGERMGMLHVVCKDQSRAESVLSQLKLIIRPMYSSPPLHGALLVSKILNNPAHFQQWCDELKMMADRILEVRKGLKEGLEKKGTPGTWDHITTQIGMFSFTGLSPKQCEALINDHHIYLLKSGRISLAGLNTGNLQYVIDAIDKVVREIKE